MDYGAVPATAKLSANAGFPPAFPSGQRRRNQQQNANAFVLHWEKERTPDNTYCLFIQRYNLNFYRINRGWSVTNWGWIVTVSPQIKGQIVTIIPPLDLPRHLIRPSVQSYEFWGQIVTVRWGSFVTEPLFLRAGCHKFVAHLPPLPRSGLRYEGKLSQINTWK